jgi:hypothetical protein
LLFLGGWAYLLCHWICIPYFVKFVSPINSKSSYFVSETRSAGDIQKIY